MRLTSNGFAIANPDRQYLARLPGIEKGELRSRASFTDRYIPIESVNGNDLIMANPAFKNNIIGFDTFTVPAHEGALWIANVLGLLDETNEYFLDEDASVVYYKPDAADMSNQNVVLPRLEYLLALAGTYDAPVHDLTFQGFNYMHTTWSMSFLSMCLFLVSQLTIYMQTNPLPILAMWTNRLVDTLAETRSTTFSNPRDHSGTKSQAPSRPAQ